MLTGTEVVIAKIAGPPVIRAIGDPVRQRATRAYLSRRLKKELYEGTEPDEIASLLSTLSPEQAAAITAFITSTEFANIAAELANRQLLGICGRNADELYNAAKEQLHLLLGLVVRLDPAELEALANLLIASLASVVANISEEAGRSIPTSTKAALLKTFAAQINSATKNCEILRTITDLTSIYDIKQQIKLQVGNVYGTMRLPHAGTTRKVPYANLYVQPRIELQSSDSSSSTKQEKPQTVDELLQTFVRVILLGDPGGGKSTLSLKLAYDTAMSADPARPTVPFLVVLREYATELTHGTKTLIDYLYDVCGMPLGVQAASGSIEYLLLNGHALVIFDGLDELLDTSLRRRVVEAVEAFAYMYPTTQILVTSRRLGYSDAPLDADLFTPASLSEFSREQVQKYVHNWFELDDSVQTERKSELRRTFLADSEFVQDLRVNPLMLSLMCGIYSSEHYIPRNRPDVYEKCALLLFDRWDKQRGIVSELAFDAHVQAAMRALALWMYPQQASHTGIARPKLVDFMTKYLLDKRFESEEEAENAASGFIDFCKGRAWVLTDVGSELYGFTHRTFLEYFAASQVVRLSPNPQQLYDFLEPRILSGGWEVVAQLALQIGNKTVEDCADDFLQLLCNAVKSTTETEGLRLLQFAVQSLTYIVPRPTVLRSLVWEVVELYSKSTPGGGVEGEAVVYLLLSAAPENWPLVSKYIYEKLVSVLESDPSNDRALWLGIFLDVLAAGAGSLRTTYGGSTTQVSFWAKERDAHRAELSQWIAARSTSLAWAAINMVEHSELEFGEALRRFDPVDLLADTVAKPVEVYWPPFIDRMILTLGRDMSGNIAISPVVSLERIDQFRKTLISLPLSVSAVLPIPTGTVVPWLIDRFEGRLVEEKALTSILFFSFVLAGGDDVGLWENRALGRLSRSRKRKGGLGALKVLVAVSAGERDGADLEGVLISAGVEASAAVWLSARAKWMADRDRGSGRQSTLRRRRVTREQSQERRL